MNTNVNRQDTMMSTEHNGAVPMNNRLMNKLAFASEEMGTLSFYYYLLGVKEMAEIYQPTHTEYLDKLIQIQIEKLDERRRREP